MSFKDLAKQILTFLNTLNNNHLKVLFGNADVFKKWLIEQGVQDKVSGYKTLIKKKKI